MRFNMSFKVPLLARLSFPLQCRRRQLALLLLPSLRPCLLLSLIGRPSLRQHSRNRTAVLSSRGSCRCCWRRWRRRGTAWKGNVASCLLTYTMITFTRRHARARDIKYEAKPHPNEKRKEVDDLSLRRRLSMPNF